MSVRAINWAFEQKLASSDKFVLFAFANFADDRDGIAFPSLKTIARMTGLNIKTVRRAVQELEARGLLADTGKRKGHTKTVRVYRVNFLDAGDVGVKTGLHPKLDDIQISPEARPNLPPTETGFGPKADQFWDPEPSITIQEPSGEPPISSKHFPQKNAAGDFDAFWAEYPRKIAKINAQKIYISVIKKGHQHEQIMEGLRRQNADWQRRPRSEHRFIPHPSTWLQQERWRDELPSSETDHDFEPLFACGGSNAMPYQNGYGGIVEAGLRVASRYRSKE